MERHNVVQEHGSEPDAGTVAQSTFTAFIAAAPDGQRRKRLDPGRDIDTRPRRGIELRRPRRAWQRTHAPEDDTSISDTKPFWIRASD